MYKSSSRPNTQPLIALGWAGAWMLKNCQKSCFNESASKGLAHPFKESLACNKKTVFVWVCVSVCFHMHTHACACLCVCVCACACVCVFLSEKSWSMSSTFFRHQRNRVSPFLMQKLSTRSASTALWTKLMFKLNLIILFPMAPTRALSDKYFLSYNFLKIKIIHNF